MGFGQVEIEVADSDRVAFDSPGPPPFCAIIIGSDAWAYDSVWGWCLWHLWYRKKI